MITIFNPTNEVFKMVYAGIDVVLGPGDKKPVEDACANHLLNSHGPRGLCQLIYGDAEEVVGNKGQLRNYEFKKTQIARYNIMNEQRKMQGMGYIPPTDYLRQYAVELGIQLLEPYTLKNEETGAIAQIRRENEELKGQMAELMKTMSNLIAQKGEPEETENPKRGRGRPKE
uniref:Uncharacterized protein n=1 Tax=viral metagenome TaxID=1070528 RepID=A0A6M3ILX7_9ZZZZ